jgi:hypothetical protein
MLWTLNFHDHRFGILLPSPFVTGYSYMVGESVVLPPPSCYCGQHSQLSAALFHYVWLATITYGTSYLITYSLHGAEPFLSR